MATLSDHQKADTIIQTCIGKVLSQFNIDLKKVESVREVGDGNVVVKLWSEMNFTLDEYEELDFDEMRFTEDTLGLIHAHGQERKLQDRHPALKKAWSNYLTVKKLCK